MASEITPITSQVGSYITKMAEDSGCATRAIVGWLSDAHMPEADMNIELLAFRYQQLVEDDFQVGASDSLGARIRS